MRIMLEEDLAGAVTLEDALDVTHQTLLGLKADGFEIHYVAGPISCDGDEHIPRNIEALIAERTRLMRSLGEGALTFVAPFVFTLENLARFGLFDIDRDQRERLLQGFWDTLIASGVIDVVHLAPGWERSPGAKRERATALANNIPVRSL